MGALEWVATGFGLACVILTIRQNIWCWPTGLAQVLLFIFVFYDARLYSDVLLHIVYVGLQIYGWYTWLHGSAGGGELRVTRIGGAAFAAWLIAGVVGTILIGTAMLRWTNADLPYWDASILMLSLIAQWLLAHKALESWIFWLVVDVLAIGLYAVKALYPTTALYTLFLVLAVIGFAQWKRTLEQPQPG